MNSRLQRTLLIINGLMLPCGCVPLVFVGNAFNPMQQVFVKDIHVTNATGQPIRITPIGTAFGHGHGALPMFHSRSPAIHSSQSGGFRVESGATVELFYDSDDIQLTEIVVEDQSGSLAQLTVDKPPSSNEYLAPNPNAFTITDLSQLEPVAADVVPAFQAAQMPHLRWSLLLTLLAPWITFGYLLLTRRRTMKPRHT